jgi:hypothetical protein
MSDSGPLSASKAFFASMQPQDWSHRTSPMARASRLPGYQSGHTGSSNRKARPATEGRPPERADTVLRSCARRRPEADAVSYLRHPHHRAIPRDQPLRWQSDADAGRVPPTTLPPCCAMPALIAKWCLCVGACRHRHALEARQSPISATRRPRTGVAG